MQDPQAETGYPGATARRILQPHQQRVVIELSDINDKLIKLAAFLETSVFAKLDQNEQDLLARQHGVMQEYARILGARIDGFNKPPQAAPAVEGPAADQQAASPPS